MSLLVNRNIPQLLAARFVTWFAVWPTVRLGEPMTEEALITRMIAQVTRFKKFIKKPQYWRAF
jgi:hypothetical protein